MMPISAALTWHASPRVVGRVLAGPLLLTLLLAWRLWLLFPCPVPQVEGFVPLRGAAYLSMLVGCAGLLVWPPRRAARLGLAGLLTVGLVVSALADQSTFSPAVYLMTLALVAFTVGGDAALTTVLAGTYLLAGAAKLNPHYPGVVVSLFGRWGALSPAVELVGLAGPLVELALGALLLSRSVWRRRAGAGMVLLHGTLLVTLIRLGWGWPVWPWNAQMLAFGALTVLRDGTVETASVVRSGASWQRGVLLAVMLAAGLPYHLGVSDRVDSPTALFTPLALPLYDGQVPQLMVRLPDVREWAVLGTWMVDTYGQEPLKGRAQLRALSGCLRRNNLILASRGSWEGSEALRGDHGR